MFSETSQDQIKILQSQKLQADFPLDNDQKTYYKEIVTQIFNEVQRVRLRNGLPVSRETKAQDKTNSNLAGMILLKCDLEEIEPPLIHDLENIFFPGNFATDKTHTADQKKTLKENFTNFHNSINDLITMILDENPKANCANLLNNLDFLSREKRDKKSFSKTYAYATNLVKLRNRELFAHYTKLVNLGDENAKPILAFFYENGLAVAKDPQQAKKIAGATKKPWEENADKFFLLQDTLAHSGDRTARLLISLCYQYGLGGIAKDHAEAVEICAEIYDQIYSLEESTKQIANYYLEGATAGDTESKQVLERYFSLEKDAEKISAIDQNSSVRHADSFEKNLFELYEMMSRSGDIRAKYVVGLFTLLGIETEQNSEKAEKIFEEVRENLSVKNVDDWEKKTIEILSKKADEKEFWAQNLLRFCYHYAIGVNKDLPRAKALLKDCKSLTEKEKCKLSWDVFCFYKNGPNASNSDAKFALALCYNESGWELDKREDNKKLSEAFLQQSGATNDAIKEKFFKYFQERSAYDDCAKYILHLCYYAGIGVEQSNANGDKIYKDFSQRYSTQTRADFDEKIRKDYEDFLALPQTTKFSINHLNTQQLDFFRTLEFVMTYAENPAALSDKVKGREISTVQNLHEVMFDYFDDRSKADSRNSAYISAIMHEHGIGTAQNSKESEKIMKQFGAPTKVFIEGIDPENIRFDPELDRDSFEKYCRGIELYENDKLPEALEIFNELSKETESKKSAEMVSFIEEQLPRKSPQVARVEALAKSMSKSRL